MISKCNKRISFSLCIIDIHSKYTGVVPLKDKKGITITKSFQKKLDESGHKPNKIWVDKGSKFYNKSMKSWLQDNYMTFIQTIKKENLLLLRELLESERIRSRNILFQY